MTEPLEPFMGKLPPNVPQAGSAWGYVVSPLRRHPLPAFCRKPLQGKDFTMAESGFTRKLIILRIVN